MWRSRSRCFPLYESHMDTVESYDAVITSLPSAENCAVHTGLVCSRIVTSSSPLCASHTLLVLSSEPVMIRRLSGEKDRAQITLLCSARVAIRFPFVTSHTLARSWDALTSKVESGENWMVCTTAEWLVSDTLDE